MGISPLWERTVACRLICRCNKEKVSEVVHPNVRFLFSSSHNPNSLPNWTKSNPASTSEVLDENKKQEEKE